MGQRCRSTLQALLLAAIALPTRVMAQGAASAERPSNDSMAVLATRLFGQSKVRVRLPSDNPDLVLLEPRLVADTLEFARYAPGSWTLDTAVAPHQMLLAGITRLQIRTSAWENGGIVGFLAGAAMIEGLNAAGKFQIGRGETLFIGSLFGLGGALVGMVIGAPFMEWKTMYQRP